MSPVTPTRIGRYFLVDRLGQGGMGVVYRGWDPQLQRAVALKVLSSSFDPVRQADVLERFLREARAAASLSHPNIVTVYDVGQHAGQPYLTMEFIEGESLAQLIGRQGALALVPGLKLALQLCTGLGFAHARGIVHRDVKPANLLITNTGDLKILDFGLAKLVGDLAERNLTVSGAIVGTPRYMAPEQAAGREVDERSDIYAVGTALFELFTGSPAFEAELPLDAAREKMLGTPPSVRQRVPSLPVTLDRALTTALAADPRERYQRLDDLAEDLKAVFAELGGAAALSAGRDESGSPSRLDNVLGEWERMVGQALAESDAGTAAPTGPYAAEAAAAPPTKSPRPAPAPRRMAPPAASGRRPWPRFGWSLVVAVALGLLGVVLYLALRPEPSEPVPAATVTVEPTSDTGAGRPADPPASSVASDNGQTLEPAVEPRPPERAGVREAGSTQVSPECVALLERVSLGEVLSRAEQTMLTQQCRGEGR